MQTKTGAKSLNIEWPRWQFVGGMAIILAGSISLSACSKRSKLDPFAGKGSPIYNKAGKIPTGGGRRHLGKPYTVAGRRYYPKDDPSYDKTGMASWYGKRFHKRQTANGEWYDMYGLSAAHKTFPLPSYAIVSNPKNGKRIVVRVNDRGPFVDTRVIDLSMRAAQVLGTKQAGTAKVRVQYIGLAPLNDNGNHLRAMNRELNRGTPKHLMIDATHLKAHRTACSLLKKEMYKGIFEQHILNRIIVLKVFQIPMAVL